MVVELREAAEAGFFGLVWDHYLCCRKGMLNGGRAWVQRHGEGTLATRKNGADLFQHKRSSLRNLLMPYPPKGRSSLGLGRQSAWLCRFVTLMFFMS